MNTVWMTWQQAGWLGALCLVAYAATVRLPRPEPPPRWLRLTHGARAVVREVGIVAVLYALWQWVFAQTVTKTAGAMSHARAIYDFEQRIGLPSELDVQHLSTHSRYVIEFLNRYYASVHVTAMGILIVWLFIRHRDRYPRVRNVLVLSTGACLAIQSIPVAPPRFLPGLGFVDTALEFGQSVYGAGGSGLSNQLAAMPSVHVTWSVLVAGAVIWASTSRWRWLVVAHPVVTLWAVIATGNHWWADAFVAVALLALAVGVMELAAAAWARVAGPDAAEPDHPEGDRAPVPIAEPAG